MYFNFRSSDFRFWLDWNALHCVRINNDAVYWQEFSFFERWVLDNIGNYSFNKFSHIQSKQMAELVKIELNNQDAELFKKFRQYQNDFEVILTAGAFNFKNGKAMLFRDAQGILRGVVIEQATYKKVKK